MAKRVTQPEGRTAGEERRERWVRALEGVPGAAEHPLHPPETLPDLVQIVDEAASEAPEAAELRERLASPDVLRWLLERDPPAEEAVRRIAGWDAARVREALVAALGEADRRSGREPLLSLLREVGLPPADRLEGVWDRLEPADRVRALLEAEEPNVAKLRGLVKSPRTGPAAVAPVVDALTDTEDRALRRKLFSLLEELKPEKVLPAVAEHLDDERWFVRRNMLNLLQKLGETPAGFSGLEMMRDEDRRVRVEAFKLAVEDPAEREAALIEGLESDDPRILRLALGAAQEDAPERAEEPLLAIAADRSRPDDARAAAVRALDGFRSEAVRETLRDLTWYPGGIIGGGLAEKSPVTLAALNVLARQWPEHRDTQPILGAAGDADDPEIRDAVETL